MNETRQECVTCGAVLPPGVSVISVCAMQKYYGSSTTFRLGSACDWRWIKVLR